MENNNVKIQKELTSRMRTHHGIYHDVGIILENNSLDDLYRYYLDVVMHGHETTLRAYIEEEITKDEINKEIVRNDKLLKEKDLKRKIKE